MGTVTHQTIKLGRGKHVSPEHGACVMELASMLAGEPFSDHPMSVCPVVGCLLRTYNDWADDDRRQDLYAYAAEVVGSRGSAELQQARADRLIAWAAERRRGRRSRLLGRLRAWAPQPSLDIMVSRAIHGLPRHDDDAHAAVLALMNELLALGAASTPAHVACPVAGATGGQPPVQRRDAAGETSVSA